MTLGKVRIVGMLFIKFFKSLYLRCTREDGKFSFVLFVSEFFGAIFSDTLFVAESVLVLVHFSLEDVIKLLAILRKGLLISPSSL